MNNLINERDERTRKRKKIKRRMDKAIDLSANDEKRTMKLSVNAMKMSDTSIRLLDEGYFDSGFFIKKGTLEKFINGKNEHIRGYEMGDDGWQETGVLNLDNDFVGTVNLGHMEFSTFPFIIGEWTKEDLKLVDIENDRKGIDVNVRLDEDSVFVKELKRQPFDIGISSEFYYHINEKDTEIATEVYGTYTPVIDEVYIFAYGLVGECGNVNSSGLELKGAVMPKELEKELMAEQEVDIEVSLENADEIAEELDAITEELGVEDEIEIPTSEENVSEETEEDVIEDSAEDADEEESEDDAEEEAEDEEDEVEEDQDEEEDLDDEDEIEEADELTEALSLIQNLQTQVAELTNRIAEKDKKIRRLSKKIAVEKEAKAKFLAETKNLSIELLPNELEAENAKAEEMATVQETNDYIRTGGVADI